MLDGFSVRIAAAEEFRAARTEWNRLAASMSFATPFSAWEWVYTWWEYFGADRQSLPLFIYRGQELRAILPLWRRPADVLGRKFGVRMLELAGAHGVYPDHLDLIAAPEDASLCMRAALDFLTRSGVPWDVLRLPTVAEDSAALSGLRHAPDRLTVARHLVTVAPYVAGPKSFEQFLGELSRNERYKLRSRSKKLLEGEGVAYVAFSRDERESALHLLLSLHERRAAEKGINSSFAQPQVQAFHRALLERMDWDHVLLRGLRHKDEVIAVFYGFRVNQRVFYFQLGHHPGWSKWSPGLVLITETIRESFGGGCKEYNFLQGDEPFKRIWAGQARTLYDCYVYNDTLRARIARGLSDLKGRLKDVLRSPKTPRMDPPNVASCEADRPEAGKQ